MTEYLDLDDLLAAADAGLGHRAELRDIGLLQAAVARPRATAFGEDAYPGLDEKAASLFHSLVTGHPLVDGNKRLGWIAVRLFYRINDFDIHPVADDAFDLVSAIAAGDVNDVVAIAAQLQVWRQAR